MKIIIVKGDITESITDAIVLAANSRLAPSSGECGAIFNKAGYEMLKDALAKYSYCKPGDAIITPGFNLNSKYIIHAVGPIYKDNPDDDLILASAYINSLNLAIENNCLTIAFPALSTGLYNYPYDLASKIAIESLYEYKKNHDNDLANVYIYCYDDEIYKAFSDANYKYINNFKRSANDILKLEESLKKRDQLIQVFKDTRALYLNDKILKKGIKYTKANSYVYKEDFKSDKIEKKSDGLIIFERLNSLEAAFKYKNEKIALLNFASGTHPGGDVLKGSLSQEEFLCRNSTLYICLNDEKGYFYEEFYNYHKEIGFMNSDRIIYSKDIIVFKNNDVLLNKNDWYKIDVLSCSAPNLKNNNILDSELLNIMKSRIKNIFEVAIDNNIDILVLGAFGCGSYNNNQNIVANAFKLNLDLYKCYFKKIIFAIPDIDFSESANYKIFYNILKE